jgi:uncharacterized membrane protein
MILALVLSLLALGLVWRAAVRITALERRVAELTQRLEQDRTLRDDAVGSADTQPAAEEPLTRTQEPPPQAASSPQPAAPPTDSSPLSPPPRGWGVAGQGDTAIGAWGARLGTWLRDHWIYPAAGAALVLSGVFLVQYAVEAGILTPQARVILALLLGAALAASGEWLRRRPVAGTILPATLAGSGIVIAMAAVLGALHLYAMIQPATALIALALLAFGAVGLGWLHGPMLAALGLVTGSLVPFVLGGGGPPPAALFGHFALLALAGLGIDTARRWGWVSWLALAGPLSGMVLWRLGGGDATAFAMALIVVAAAAMTLPFGRVMPVAEGAHALSRGRAPRSGVRVSFVASGVAALGAALLVATWAGPLALTALALLISVWARRAPALADQMVLPVLAFPAWIVWQSWTYGPIYAVFVLPRLPESAMPLQAGILVLLALAGGLAMLWRGEVEDPGRHAPWTLAGLALPGGTVAALESTWAPAMSVGAYVWALQIMALAGMATALALRYAGRDAGQGPRLGASAASAFGLIALALMVMLGLSALTVALAVLMIAAALMDRRFDIPALGAFQVLASLTLLWRLVLDPGVGWLLGEAHQAEVLVSLAATLLGPLGALWLSQGLPPTRLRNVTRLIVETGLVAAASISAGVVTARILPQGLGLHAQIGLQATVLMSLAWSQARRSALPFGQRVRRVLAWVLGIGAAGLLALALVPASTVFGAWIFQTPVSGWPVLNDLILAYLLPGVLLILLADWRSLRAAGWALAAVWAACAIRHLWQGADLALWRGVAQGELYAYTFAMLVVGGVLLARAVLAGRSDLRKLGLVVIAVAAAKAFLIDASGLDGLLRVGAFLGLGLSLAGLAWVNGWAVARDPSRPEGPQVR